MTNFDLPARSAISPDVPLDGGEALGPIESPFALDPGPTQHHLDQGPEHLRSTPNVHEQEEVEDPEAEAGAGRTAREIIVQHLAHCATDAWALPAVELAREMRRQLLGKVGQEGCPGWALKLFVMGGPVATHQLHHEMGRALQEVAAVFAEAMQAAVDRVRQEAEERRQRDETDVLDLLNARQPFAVQVGSRVITLSGLRGVVTGVEAQSFAARMDFGDSEEGTDFFYTRTGEPVPGLSVGLEFPLVERLRLTIASIQPPKET